MLVYIEDIEKVDKRRTRECSMHVSSLAKGGKQESAPMVTPIVEDTESETPGTVPSETKDVSAHREEGRAAWRRAETSSRHPEARICESHSPLLSHARWAADPLTHIGEVPARGKRDRVWPGLAVSLAPPFRDSPCVSWGRVTAHFHSICLQVVKPFCN
ncbi:hypothetical protein MC885_001319 [Smutsia gigantea]|nr:hypothetical protein MC885_001319 [Smutsia gigantea]